MIQSYQQRQKLQPTKPREQMTATVTSYNSSTRTANVRYADNSTGACKANPSYSYTNGTRVAVQKMGANYYIVGPL